jgi:hypothetical protein
MANKYSGLAQIAKNMVIKYSRYIKDQISGKMANKYSGSMIGQIAWFIVSIYLAVVLTDLVKDGLFKAVMTPKGDLRKLAIIIPALTFYLITVIEAYPWLSPPETEQLSGPDAVFRFAHLVPYFAGIVFQAFLTYACTNTELQGDDPYFVWARSFGWVLFSYAVYNALWIVNRLIPHLNKRDCPTCPRICVLLVFYLFFACVFVWGFPRFAVHRPDRPLCVWYVVFIVLYVVLWRDWYPHSFRVRPPTPAAAPGGIARQDEPRQGGGRAHGPARTPQRPI